MHVGSGRIRAASVWLRAALLGGDVHLGVLFAIQLKDFSSLAKVSCLDLVCLSRLSCPCL